MRQSSQGSTALRGRVPFSLDLPPPNSEPMVRIFFCGRPARTTGVVNLRLLLGNPDYVLTEKRRLPPPTEGDEKANAKAGRESKRDKKRRHKHRSYGGAEEAEDREDEAEDEGEEEDGAESKSRSTYRLCSSDGLPPGCFRVKRDRHYWVMQGNAVEQPAESSLASSPTAAADAVAQPLTEVAGSGEGEKKVAEVKKKKKRSEKESPDNAKELEEEGKAKEAPKRKRSRHDPPQTSKAEDDEQIQNTDDDDDDDTPFSQVFASTTESANHDRPAAVAEVDRSPVVPSTVPESGDVVEDVEATLGELFFSPPVPEPSPSAADVAAAAEASEKPRSSDTTAAGRGRRKRATKDVDDVKTAPQPASVPASMVDGAVSHTGEGSAVGVAPATTSVEAAHRQPSEQPSNAAPATITTTAEPDSTATSRRKTQTRRERTKSGKSAAEEEAVAAPPEVSASPPQDSVTHTTISPPPPPAKRAKADGSNAPTSAGRDAAAVSRSPTPRLPDSPEPQPIHPPSPPASQEVPLSEKASLSHTRKRGRKDRQRSGDEERREKEKTDTVPAAATAEPTTSHASLTASTPETRTMSHEQQVESTPTERPPTAAPRTDSTKGRRKTVVAAALHTPLHSPSLPPHPASVAEGETRVRASLQSAGPAGAAVSPSSPSAQHPQEHMPSPAARPPPSPNPRPPPQHPVTEAGPHHAEKHDNEATTPRRTPSAALHELRGSPTVNRHGSTSAPTDTSPTLLYSNRSSGGGGGGGNTRIAPLTSPFLKQHQQQQQFTQRGGSFSAHSAQLSEPGSFGMVPLDSPALGFTEVNSTLAEVFSLDPSGSDVSTSVSEYLSDG